MPSQRRLIALSCTAVFLFTAIALLLARLLPPGSRPSRSLSTGQRSQEGLQVAAQVASFEAEEPLYAMADLHGDLGQALKALRLVGLADATGTWTGGKATLVQTGDLLDRGPDSLALVSLFERLKDEAQDAGGAVYTLLGNHELMNLNSQFAYVSREELAALGAAAVPVTADKSTAQLLTDGVRVWRHRMAPDAPVGKALRQRLGAIIRGSGPCRTLFVHAALLPDMLTELKEAASTQDDQPLLAALNRKIHGILGCKSKTCKPMRKVLDDEGSLVWSRAFVQWPHHRICPLAKQVLEQLGAQRMVVGHNVMQDGRIKSICEGRVHLIDVGISATYGGNMAVYECRHGVASAVYEGGRRERLSIA